MKELVLVRHGDLWGHTRVARSRCKALEWMTLAACVAAVSGCGGGAAARGPAEAVEPGADAIECTFFYRESNEVLEGQSPDDPSFQFTEESFTLAMVGDEVHASEAIELGGLRVEGNLTSDRFEGAAFVLAVHAGDTRLFRSLHQFDHGSVPRNLFHGDHGFTGLIYLTHPEDGGDYQLICKSVPLR